MARLPRLFMPEFPVHAVVRGNDRQDIFQSEGDRIYFHRCLVETTRKHQTAVHAYVFMTNHVHLLVTGKTPDSLGKVIQTMGRRYVAYFNYLYRRTGTLWEGRFKSSVVQTERYFLACQRYIEMNPVRAGLVERPADFFWSSFMANRIGRPDDLVTPHSLYLEMGRTPDSRHAAYARLFEGEMGGDDKTIRDALQQGWAVGDQEFCERLGHTTGRRLAPRPRGRPRKIRN